MKKVLTAILWLTVTVALVGCDTLKKDVSSSTCDAEIRKAMAQVEIEGRKGFLALQMEVVKQCVAKGNIPVLSGGNVACVLAPK